jgi:hypothetical protein
VPAQRVRLPGPPIARACTLRPSHDWIQCALTADGFDVSADTSCAGRFEGTIEVKGPTGRAMVTVELDVAGRAAGPASQPEAGPAPEVAATPAPTPDPETAPEPEPVASSAAASAPEPVFVSAAPAAVKPVPVPSRAPRRSGLIQRLAFRDRIRRWWHGPDRPAARVGGAVVLAALLSL